MLWIIGAMIGPGPWPRRTTASTTEPSAHLRTASITIGFPAASFGAQALVSGYTDREAVVIRFCLTIAGTTHPMEVDIPALSSQVASGPGAGDEALGIRFMVARKEGRPLNHAVQTAQPTIYPLLAEWSHRPLQAEAGPLPQVHGRRGRSRALLLIAFFKQSA